MQEIQYFDYPKLSEAWDIILNVKRDLPAMSWRCEPWLLLRPDTLSCPYQTKLPFVILRRWNQWMPGIHNQCQSFDPLDCLHWCLAFFKLTAVVLHQNMILTHMCIILHAKLHNEWPLHSLVANQGNNSIEIQTQFLNAQACNLFLITQERTARVKS